METIVLIAAMTSITANITLVFKTEDGAAVLSAIMSWILLAAVITYRMLESS